MTSDDYAAMVLDEKGNLDGFNPFRRNIVFSKDMVRALRDERERRKNEGVVEQVVKKDTAVQLGQPRIYPEELVKAILNYLKH